MFARRIRASWPGVKSSVKLMLGSDTEAMLAVRLADGPVCRQPRILRKTAVFLGTSTLIFASAAWVTNLNEARWWEEALKDQLDASGTKLCGPLTGIDDNCPTKHRIYAFKDTLQDWHDTHIKGLPRPLYPLARGLIDGVWTFAGQSDSYRVLKICMAVHVGIFLAWRFPRCRRFLATHTLHHGLSGRSYTMFISGFSHMDLPHLAFNTFSLYFLVQGLTCISVKDGEYPSWTYAMPQSLAFWIVAGAFSVYFPQLISLIAFRKAITALPPTATLMAHALQPWHPVPLLVTFGASGVVYALGAMLVCNAGEHELSLTIAGHHILSARQLGLALLSAEAMVHLFFWTGAPGHLSGALFGVLYYRWGSQYWQWMRDHVGNRRSWYELDENGKWVRACVRVLKS